MEATPKANGHCLVCGGSVLAKCGSKRIWHWAHRVQTKCDHWWENETLWHRTWKQKFPNDWQEVIVKGRNDDLHIADVKTKVGLIVEFQHSYLTEIEQEEREQFYGNMIWVVDGCNGNSGYGSLMENIQFWLVRDGSLNRPGVKFNPLIAKITKRWHTSHRPVFIDFGGSTLWSISVSRFGWAKYALEIRKDDFVQSILHDIDPVARLSPW
jgi:hypothetical protein